MLYVAVVILFLIVVYFLKKQAASSEVYSRFGIRESTHKLLSTDLGKSASRIKLTRFGINGIADAVFKALSGKEILVGEFKSRKHRGIVKLYEFYQLMLYMGHLQEKYPDHMIRGCLAYADAKVSVTFDSEVYEALVSLRSEYWASVNNRGAVNTKPLHKRVKVNALNGRVKLSAEL
ncbi:hypothetical protein [Pseudomonas sp. MWU12-2323]|uniref:hypothetical protein n=1 Tax=Pseudomonas sp. MWU12-2323 TaxID=2651296 RepID=UPI00128BA168|nr:hypothetical protein [Pseudomonas sp. MWU12-2323]MPQ69314.1 hypothetical protein [Pseudomonas sp. MWU12-2323]